MSEALKNLTVLRLNEPASAALAQSLGRLLQPGDCLALMGPLGAGKSSFARALIQHFLPQEEVPSPTFTLVQTYDTPGFCLWHYDLYRVEHPAELAELAIDEALAQGVCVMEWPEIARDLLPADRLEISFLPTEGEDERNITLRGGATWQRRWPQLNIPA